MPSLVLLPYAKIIAVSCAHYPRAEWNRRNMRGDNRTLCLDAGSTKNLHASIHDAETFFGADQWVHGRPSLLACDALMIVRPRHI